ncbi:hypothetical protein JOD63_001355 [Microbacterium terrae]|uniref:PH domain-containing protein n=1 Tax=Microbacterium terrae TaxID=69369 RepID=A0A0M2H1M7_9MICO|nr:hypothetical protein [Microbacterium terrae]KJL37978.1 hypothetical protein RS81_02974 [Microbacterium terrae]MBP1077387.1 hypothetical protein [Microbacterium terrae]
MTQALAVALMIALAVALLASLLLAWWVRTRRDAGLAAPVGEAPAGATEIASFETLYVATTRAGEPLERLAIRGLGFRSRADVTVLSTGVAIDLTGQPRLYLAADRIADVAQATVTIDRVVESDGLTRLSWRLDDGTVVDSYLRPQDASARALADAIGGILPTLHTGSDA